MFEEISRACLIFLLNGCEGVTRAACAAPACFNRSPPLISSSSCSSSRSSRHPPRKQQQRQQQLPPPRALRLSSLSLSLCAQLRHRSQRPQSPQRKPLLLQPALPPLPRAPPPRASRLCALSWRRFRR